MEFKACSRRVAPLVLALGAMFSGGSAVAAYSGLYAFGDSLSDNGNAFALSGGTVPASPYYQGRFSDGPVAIEYVASGLGFGAGQFHDFAIGGARTGLTGSGGSATGMLAQLAGFQAALGGGSADSNALYVVWGGANDLNDGFANNTVASAITTAVANLSTVVNTLHMLGARNFLLPNSADLGLTPQARAGGGSALASAATDIFNAQLLSAYQTLANQWADETFVYFDTTTAHRALTASAPGNGLSNVTDACFVAAPTSLCASPSTYMYWDSIHPSGVTHQALGSQMLAAVPEPESLALMASGLLVLAWRRQRQA
jgi:phospholipase/lecithinase/hemolysin